MSTNTLSLSQCKTYLRNIMLLEIQCYQLNQLGTSLNRRRDAVQRETTTLSEEKPLQEDLVQPTHMQQLLSAIVHALLYGVIGIIIGAIIGMIAWIVVWIWNVFLNGNILIK